MIAPTRDPLDKAEVWPEEHVFHVTTETDPEELALLIDIAVGTSEATGACHDRKAISIGLTEAFEDFAG